VDGTTHEFDLIVHATGYHVSFPILADDLIQWTEVTNTPPPCCSAW